MNGVDQTNQYGDGETFTREEYRRLNGTGPVPSTCAECGKDLTEIQVKRGGKFYSSQCAGAFNARLPAKPKPVLIVDETPTSQPEGWDHPAPTVTPGETAVGWSGAAPAAEKRVPATAGANGGEPPLRAAGLPIHPVDHGLIHIAAALVDVLLAIPGTRSVEMWVGPIGPIEVRR